MKKFYILSILTLFAVSVYAQREVGKMIKMPAQNIEMFKTVTDTLLPGNMANATGFAQYGVQDESGYVFGTNEYGDWCKAEQFIVLTPYAIEGAIYWFGDKVVSAGTGVVEMNVWNMDGTGTTLAGAGQDAPGTVLGGVTETVGNIDTATMLADAYVAIFTTPISVTDDYAIGIDVSAVYAANDSIGLVSSLDGDGGSFELAWEQWSDGDWYTMQAAGWGSGTFDADIVIMPMVDMNAGSVEEGNFINGLKMSSYPNPATDVVTLAYELESNAKNVVIRILNTNGQNVAQLNLGTQSAGVYNVELDVTEFAAGTYYFLINAGANRLAKRMMVTR